MVDRAGNVKSWIKACSLTSLLARSAFTNFTPLPQLRKVVRWLALPRVTRLVGHISESGNSNKWNISEAKVKKHIETKARDNYQPLIQSAAQSLPQTWSQLAVGKPVGLRATARCPIFPKPFAAELSSSTHCFCDMIPCQESYFPIRPQMSILRHEDWKDFKSVAWRFEAGTRWVDVGANQYFLGLRKNASLENWMFLQSGVPPFGTAWLKATPRFLTVDSWGLCLNLKDLTFLSSVRSAARC